MFYQPPPPPPALVIVLPMKRTGVPGRRIGGGTRNDDKQTQSPIDYRLAFEGCNE